MPDDDHLRMLIINDDINADQEEVINLIKTSRDIKDSINSEK